MAHHLTQRCKTVADQIARSALDVGPTDIVLMCWASYADPFFVPLRSSLEQQGVYVVAQRWDDNMLARALAEWPASEVARLWQPLLADGCVRLPRARSVPATRMVLLSSPPVSEAGQRICTELGLDAAIAAGQQSLAAAHTALWRVTMVEWPRGARRDASMDLSAADVLGLYLDALAHDRNDTYRTNMALADVVQGSVGAHLQCPNGTDLVMSTERRRWIVEPTVVGPGPSPMYLPGGEVYVAVDEQKTTGTLVFLDEGRRCRLSVRDGLPIELTAPTAAHTEKLKKMLRFGREPISELGIGTNRCATALQVGSLCEKAYGAVHVAIGANRHLGGMHESPIHVDLLVTGATLRVDGVRVVCEGSLTLGSDS